MSTVHMDCDDRRGARRHAFADGLWIDAKAIVDVSQYRDRADIDHSCSNCYPHVSRDDHLLSWTNAKGGKCRDKASCAASNCQGVLDTQKRRKFRLEGVHFRLRSERIIAVE